jgi:mono/diheme cytochrome c family protein
VVVRARNKTVLIAVAGAFLYVGIWVEQRMAPESSPVARGAAYAQPRGCVECHGDPEKPLLDANHNDCSDVNTMSWHPDYEAECADVLAYFETVRLRRSFKHRKRFNTNNPLLAGEQLVRQYHCFNCHGPLGQGGFKNPGSLKGYVPGYFGSDFKALTRNADPESVRDWITHGMDAEILEKPVTGRIAAFYFKRQAVSMPSYKSLKADEIEILVNYVIALNRYGAITAEEVRSYGQQSRSTDSLTSIDK